MCVPQSHFATTSSSLLVAFEMAALNEARMTMLPRLQLTVVLGAWFLTWVAQGLWYEVAHILY